MRDVFPGWYAKSPEDLKALWDAAIFVPDTNILLHLIRHSASIRAQLMSVFERKRDSLWIPYQVGMEFQRRRLDVQQSTLDAYDKLTEEMEFSLNQARGKLNQYRAHPVIDIEDELSRLGSHFADFKNRIAAARAKHPSEELAASFDRVTTLFVGRVGGKPSEERLAAIRKDGEERYAKKLPPGYEDAKKTEGDKFGDLIIWKEMIEKAKGDQRPMIFVTDDGKSDWWYIHHGKKVGPHPHLVEEFLADTNQQFHIYELPQFLRYSVETGSTIQPEAVAKIVETIVADAQAVSDQSASSERALTIKALRYELRSKEHELDGLIKSLIDFPPKTTEESAHEETKRDLKSRISDLTGRVNTLRKQFSAFELESSKVNQD